MRNGFLLIALAVLGGTHLQAQDLDQTASGMQALDDLTLEQALAIAERHHPQLAEAQARVDAAAGRARQSGLLPNPEVIVGAQQLPLNGNGGNQREFVAGMSQTVPVGGRLSKGREAELLERDVQRHGLDQVRREIRKRVHGSFATVLYQQQAFEMQTRLLQHWEKTVTTTRARLEAGDAPRDELVRAEMELARARMESERSKVLLDRSKALLAADLGDSRLEVNSISGVLETIFEIPTLETLAADIPDLPETRAAEAGVRAAEARLNRARAERIPDIKVEALYHRLEAVQANTIDVGVSIPLPLFDRNQGRLQETRAEAAAAEARARSTQLDLQTRLREAHTELTSALAGRRVLREEVLSRADALVKSAEARYAAGDTGLTDLLMVRRDWVEVQLAYLESVRAVMQAWGTLSALRK